MFQSDERQVEPVTKTSIHHLPGELLLGIFSSFRPDEHSKAPIVALIRLSSICRSWRAVIINTADFWTFVNIYIPQNSKPERVECYLFWIETQLRRTKSLLIDVRLTLHNLDKDASIKVFTIIATHAPFNRWRSLVFRGGLFIDVGGGIPCGNFDNLQTLEIYCPLPAWFSDRVTTTANKLKKVIANRETPFPINYSFISDRITHFSSYDPHELQFDVLSNVTHLEVRHNRPLRDTMEPFIHVTHLYVDEVDPGVITGSLFPNVQFIQGGLLSGPSHHPSLRHLVATKSRRGSLTSLKAPNLEVLELKGVHDLFDFRQNTINQGGNYHLQPTTLVVEIGVSPSSIVDILVVYSRVQHLHLSFRTNWPSWDILEQKLTSRVVAGWECCPQLAKFDVTLLGGRKERDPWPGIAERIFQERRDLESVRIKWACGSQFAVSRLLV